MEARKFQMHDKLLLDVIKKQAGSIEKALLEGVMNSIEAGATKVTIEILPRQITINDDGKGFCNREEIEKFFETFGQPHDASEGKKWAQFRMGRGQMFAFGKNHWTTGLFEMKVDINERLGYDLFDRNKAFPGCKIVIDLYEGLSDRDIYAISRGLERQVKYVTPPIILNEKQINTDPDEKKWGAETNEDAYIRITDNGSRLEVYNMGVLVCDVPQYEHGVAGTIVSKKRLEVNFARNDIIKSCPVWRRIKNVVEQSAGVEKVKRKTTLDPNERLNMIERLCSGELTRDEAEKLPLFVDVSGKAWSARQISSSDFPNWSYAEKNNHKGDKLIQMRRALVLDEEILRAFDCKPEEVFSAVWNEKRTGNYSCTFALGSGRFKLKYAKFEALSKDVDSNYYIVPQKDLKKSEFVWQTVIDMLQSRLANRMDRNAVRRIVIGMSNGKARGWTDGSTYIAFDRDFLANNRMLKTHGRVDIGSLATVAQVLAHELCHDTDSRENVHSPEFYKAYHDMQIRGRGESGNVAWALDFVFGQLTPARMDMMLKHANAKCKEDCEKLAIAAEPVAPPATPKIKKVTAPARKPVVDSEKRMAGEIKDAAEIKRIAKQYKENGGTMTFLQIEQDPENRLKVSNGMTAYRICQKYAKIKG